MIQRRFWGRGSGSAFAALAAFVTTVCCLGFPALVGFLSVLGAGFLLDDRYLEPLLAGMLLLTLLIAGLHLRRHHQPGPLLLSLVAAGSTFFAMYGIGLLPQVTSGDHMADGMATLPLWSPYLAYGAILVLLAAQIWDLWLFRRCTRSPLLLTEIQKKGLSCAELVGGVLTITDLSFLSLFLDHSLAGAFDTLRRNSPGQFSQPQYEPDHDLRISLRSWWHWRWGTGF